MNHYGVGLFVAVTLSACAAASTPAGTPEPAPAPAPPVDDAEPGPSAVEPPAAEPGAPANPQVEPIAEDQPEPGSLRAKIMRDHFKGTVDIRNAVISGHITRASKPAQSIAELKGVETLPKLWQDSVRRLSAAAKRLNDSSDLQESAAATADLGRACGACHAAVSGPKVKLGDPPPVGSTMKQRMKRHQLGTERMWEALYVPSSEAWKAGVDVLVADPFPKQDVGKGGVHAISAANRFNASMEKAKTAKSAADRAAAYADVLSTCAPCHNAMGVGK
jgi:cytochrome c556